MIYRPIEGEPLHLPGRDPAQAQLGAGEVKNVSDLVATGVDKEGYRCILGVLEGDKEDIFGAYSGSFRSSILEIREK